MVEIPVISVVDDDASVRIAIGNLVRSLGYEVHAFPSAEAFLQSVQLTQSWCVIADVRMPGTSGIELQSWLRAQYNRVPFIFITAVVEDGVRARALKDGALCLLTKPVDQDNLIGYLARAIAQHHDRTGN